MLVCLCMLCGMTACNPEPQKATRTVTVQTEGGMALADVRVNIYHRGDTTDMIWAGMTDENGIVLFEAAADAPLDATVTELAGGFKAEDVYPLTGDHTALSVKTALQEGELSAHTFALGDMMCDFTVTAGDAFVTSSTLAVSYTLSELLKTKKAVVLNFWFENCGPCRAEFPYLQKAYEKYADKLEVLAINPYDGTAKSVQTYAANLGLTFPVVKADETWQSAIKLSAYPTTVVIDRYGMITMIHKGSITEEGVFEAIFDHVLADDYVQGTVRNVSDLG